MYDYPIIVIGAGAGGLVVAIGAAKAGKKVLLIDRGVWGGDCTNYGCIPSKTLIATGDLERVREVVREVRQHEEPEALHKLGVETLEGMASFEDPHTLLVNGKKVTGKKIVIATGSYPIIPDINGVPYLTNETIFDLKEIPRHLAIIGGGPIGCELGQAFRKCGSEVTLFEQKDRLLLKDEPEAGEVLLKVFQEQGIDVRLNSTIEEVRQEGEDILVNGIRASHLLVAAGRAPHLEELNLPAAGVKFERHGIPTDTYGRTSKKHIFAVGDVTLHPPFTHMAEYVARQVLATLILPGFLKKRIDLYQACPHCTYTDPEVASAGLSEEEAIKKHGKKRIVTYFVPMSEVDRAITAGRTEGFVKVITHKWSSGILGFTIVSPRAGEMTPELSLAMRYKIPFRALSSLIHPYPTYSLAIRKAADQWLTKTVLKK